MSQIIEDFLISEGMTPKEINEELRRYNTIIEVNKTMQFLRMNRETEGNKTLTSFGIRNPVR